MADFVFLCVIGGRFLLPLLIPRFPLPAIIACLVLDGIDQSIFQAFGYDPPGYQSYDKAMDIFYLAIAYLATMRNWQNLGAYAVARFLFFYRLVGAFIFEMTHVRGGAADLPEHVRVLLHRLRGDPHPLVTRRYALRWWIIAGGADLDLRQAAAGVLAARRRARRHRHPGGLLVGVAGADPGGGRRGVVPVVRRPAEARPDRRTRWQVASDPMPTAVDTVAKQAALRVAGGWVVSWMTVEKIVLVGLMSVIYAQILPRHHGVDTRSSSSRSGCSSLLNAAITLLASRREWTIESAGLAVGGRVAA